MARTDKKVEEAYKAMYEASSKVSINAMGAYPSIVDLVRAVRDLDTLLRAHHRMPLAWASPIIITDGDIGNQLEIEHRIVWHKEESYG